MSTQTILIALVVVLFWVAPRPSESQARMPRRTDARVNPSTSPRISIMPYVKPTAAKSVHQPK